MAAPGGGRAGVLVIWVLAVDACQLLLGQDADALQRGIVGQHAGAVQRGGQRVIGGAEEPGRESVLAQRHELLIQCLGAGGVCHPRHPCQGRVSARL